MTTTTSELPEEIAAVLVDAYTTYQQAHRDKNTELREERGKFVAAYAQRGKNAGWTLASLAGCMGITAEWLRQLIVNREDTSYVLPDGLPEYPAYKPVRRRNGVTKIRPARKEAPSLTAEQAKDLAELTEVARKNTGSKALDAPERIASEKLSLLLKQYHDAGITWAALEFATGLSRSGVRMRVTRHDPDKEPPPSVPRYQGVYLHDMSRNRTARNRTSRVKQSA